MRPQGWVAGVLLLAACSPDSGGNAQTTAPLPTGHYEGPISYQGTELRVTLDLREVAPGKLQADVRFPQVPGLEFEATRLNYQEPQLQLAQGVGGISLQAVREGDFLRGVFSWDSVRTDFVWARRGEAAARPFREQILALRSAGGAQAGQLRIPDDTLTRHPAVALVAQPQTLAAAQTRAAYLARRGFVTLVVTAATPSAPSDSGGYRTTGLALAALRQHSAVDSGRVGCWVRGSLAPQVAAAASQTSPAHFVVLEAAPAATREQAAAYLPLSRQRVPVLALYAGLDTTTDVRESARRIRLVLGYLGNSQVRVYPQTNAEFLQRGRTSPDGQWQWPKPAAGYWEDLVDWLRRSGR
ncbi:hypothetical protein HNQ93_000571 [Hymenobacter luteus]|uniref:Dienelactone hydrolase domain-containing protein n=2 Tax=Hymenobacter TaxID=89966 RepID=A0A7W9WAX4_9BACT|nr:MULTISPECIES: hypothetical protein [Hymenobacter]MBB4599949.1 hypothetical protein [Hymenobacter latericoloratus]MBB6057741.1 hypothetical protein [Hymenobacter luteus]